MRQISERYFDPTGATASGTGHYLAIAPHRVMDTRCGSTPPKAGMTAAQCASEALLGANATKGTVAPGATVNVATGLTATSAAVIQVTATDTTANGFLTAYSGTGTKPMASNVNFVAGQTTSSRAIVPVGTDGSINIFDSDGSTDVVVDVVGSFSGNGTSPTAGALFTPIAPARIIDTRASAPLGSSSSGAVQIAGAVGIPAEVGGQPTAVALNITEATATTDGYLTVTRDTITPPATTSDVNFAAGQTRANADVATLDPTGAISVYNHDGNTDYIVDAFGYFAAVSPAG